MSAPRVPVFFYGSYMDLDVLKGVDLVPEAVEVARLPGYDIRVGPLANVVRSEDHSVFGILADASHAELERLYAHAREVLGGVYLPEPVVVETRAGRLAPALCYVAHALEPGNASADYLERVLAAARHHGFPDWYLARLEAFRG